MASTAGTDGGRLNPEPSQPEQRAEQDLAPKSYAAAVTESPSQNAATNATGSTDQNGHNGTTNGTEPSIPKPTEPRDPAELNPLPKSYAAAVTEPAAEKTTLNGHTSEKDGLANGSVNRKAINGQRKQLDDDGKLVYEKHTDPNGQARLTSIKPSDHHEESLYHSVATVPREQKSNRPAKRQDIPSGKLSSGRRAGAGWEKSAIRWAPLNVPLQRRLQTMAVLWHTITIPIFLSLFFLLCAIPLSWPLLIPYLIYTLLISEDATNGTLSRRSERLRRSKVWSAFASYFPARLHRTVELEPTRKYIFGYHPHGIVSHGAFAAFATEALGFSELYPGITNTLLTLDTNFRVPFYRDYALAMGVASVSRESIENILSKGGHNGEGMGRAVTIVIGGARESLDARPGTLRLVLKSRKGFVKLAIRQGADLVPVLAFGENDLYDQIDSVQHPWIHKSQMIIKKAMGFTIPLFHARGIFNYDVGLLPYRHAINIVVGRPIKVVQQGAKDNKVDEAYLDQVHAEYVDELVRLWDSYKDTFAKDRRGEIEIID
ncbi:Diacylglycerol O-acyltransferase 2A [Exophiala dermatitidis]